MQAGTPWASAGRGFNAPHARAVVSRRSLRHDVFIGICFARSPSCVSDANPFNRLLTRSARKRTRESERIFSYIQNPRKDEWFRPHAIQASSLSKQSGLWRNLRIPLWCCEPRRSRFGVAAAPPRCGIRPSQ